MQLKQGIYLFFYHLRAFFELTFKPLFGLITVGLILSAILIQSPATKVEGSLVLAGCIISALWITLVRYYYSAILRWSDTRKSKAAVIEFPRQSDN